MSNINRSTAGLGGRNPWRRGPSVVLSLTLCLFSLRELIYQTSSLGVAVWFVGLCVNAGSAWLAIGQQLTVRAALIVGIFAASFTLCIYFATTSLDGIESIHTVALVATISLFHNVICFWIAERRRQDA